MANGGQWVENIQSAYSLLAYNRNADQANVIAFDGSGKVRLNAANGNFGNAWDLIVPGNFLGYQEMPSQPPPAPPPGEPPPAPVLQFFPGDQVLAYSRSVGQAALAAFAATGKVGPKYTYSGWRTTWDMNSNFGNSWNTIVAGVFLGTSVTWTWQAS
jgi:hypothetical protein